MVKIMWLWNNGPLGKSRFANRSSTTCMWTIAIAKVLPGVTELQREAVIHKLSQKLVILRPCWESFKNEIREFRWKNLASPTPPLPLPSQRMQWNTFHQRHCVRISHSTQHKGDLKTFLLSIWWFGHTNKMELQVFLFHNCISSFIRIIFGSDGLIVLRPKNSNQSRTIPKPLLEARGYERSKCSTFNCCSILNLWTPKATKATLRVSGKIVNFINFMVSHHLLQTGQMFAHELLPRKRIATKELLATNVSSNQDWSN